MNAQRLVTCFHCGRQWPIGSPGVDLEALTALGRVPVCSEGDACAARVNASRSGLKSKHLTIAPAPAQIVE